MSMLPDKQATSTKTSSIYLSRPWLLLNIAAVSVCLVISSVVEIAIKVSSRNTEPDYDLPVYIRYPEGLMDVPQTGLSFFEFEESLLFVSAAVCMASSLIAAMAVYHTARKGPWNALFWIRVIFRTAIVASSVMALVAFVCLFATHVASARFEPDSDDQRTAPWQSPCNSLGCPQPHVDYIYPVTFDRESWFCQFASYPRFTLSPWPYYNTTDGPAGIAPDLSIYKKRCALERGARWSSIFPVIFSVALCFLFYVDWKGDNLFMRTWKRRAQEPDNNSEWGMEDGHE
ncbi:hypothetical protein GE09DRAFT_362088 [Coniochaeta sp. 2T2.1]|nr:hypothetical protein GE09DRAFT_362088 [Coniochaeta sp. 2T2.1]